MNENRYPLTLAHVRDYLATKGEDESLGLCYNAQACLLANVLTWLYPQAAPWRVDIGSYAARGVFSSDTPAEVEFLRAAFDAWTPVRSLTKRQLRARLVEAGEARRMPFAVTELFGEVSDDAL